MADTTNKLITLPLLSLFKDKLQAWTQNEDATLRAELLSEIGKLTSFECIGFLLCNKIYSYYIYIYTLKDSIFCYVINVIIKF